MTEEQKRNESYDIRLARAIRQECLKAARDGFNDASIQGLCTDGAIEAALSAIERLDLSQVVRECERTE